MCVSDCCWFLRWLFLDVVFGLLCDVVDLVVGDFVEVDLGWVVVVFVLVVECGCGYLEDFGDFF